MFTFHIQQKGCIELKFNIMTYIPAWFCVYCFNKYKVLPHSLLFTLSTCKEDMFGWTFNMGKILPWSGKKKCDVLVISITFSLLLQHFLQQLFSALFPIISLLTRDDRASLHAYKESTVKTIFKRWIVSFLISIVLLHLF